MHNNWLNHRYLRSVRAVWAVMVAAVKWNFDDLLSREKTSWVYSYFTQVESTEVVDPHTFRVIMKEPTGTMSRATTS